MTHAQTDSAPTELAGQSTPFYRVARAMLMERHRRVVGHEPTPWGNDDDTAAHVARLVRLAASDD